MRGRLACAGLGSVFLLACASPRATDPLALCSEAHRHLMDVAGMATVMDVDTIDDWRTDRVTVGCRVTAAGLTDRPLRSTASSFFEQLAEAEWVRTPEPEDAPGEASLRFRKGVADCLFSFYSGGLLGTDAEFEVDDLRIPGLGESRFNFLVQCVPVSAKGPGG